MNNHNYSIIKDNDGYIIYNDKTGIFLKANKEVIKLLKESNSNTIKQLAPNVYSTLSNGGYIKGCHDYKKRFYPKVSPYCIWNNNSISFHLHNLDNILKLSRLETSFFKLCDGNNSLKMIQKSLKLNDKDTDKLLVKWTSFSTQVIKLFQKPFIKEDLIYFKYFIAKSQPHIQSNVINHEKYYKTIKDTYLQFEEIETTISYLLRKPSQILEGKTYGERFCEKSLTLIDNNKYLNILEIGGGLGDFANSFNNELISKKINYDYTIMDISESLSQAQQDKCEDHGSKIQYLIGNAEKPLKHNEKFDMIILNEVIADLSSTKISSENKLVKNSIERYNIKDCIKKDTYINTGTMELIKNAKNYIKSNGLLIMTEFTEADGSSQITNCIFDHGEVSINFEVLKRVGKHLGYEVKILDLFDFLEVNQQTLVLSPDSFRPLKIMLRQYGEKIDKLIYSRDEIMKKYNFENIKYTKLTSFTHFFKIIIFRSRKQ